MAQFAFSNFAGTPGDTLTTFDPNWIRHSGSTASVNAVISSGLEAMGNANSGAALYYYNVAPGTPDYSVTTPVHEVSDIANGVGPCVRMNAAVSTFYHARWYFPGATDVIQLFKFVSGTPTQLGADQNANFTTGATRDLKLEAIDDGLGGVILNIYIDGNPAVFFTFTDSSSPITAAGFAGIRLGYGGATPPSNTTGPHLASFSGDTVGGAPVNDLTIGNCQSNAAASNVTITQTQVLVIGNASSATQASDVAITIGAAVDLAIDPLSCTPQASNVSITVASGNINLAIAGASSNPVLAPAGVQLAHNNALAIRKLIGS